MNRTIRPLLGLFSSAIGYFSYHAIFKKQCEGKKIVATFLESSKSLEKLEHLKQFHVRLCISLGLNQ